MKLGMLSRYGVEARTRLTAREITPEGVVVAEDGKTKLLECDTIVTAVGVLPAETLHEKIKEHVSKVIVIGDAKKPQNGYQAIRDGFKAAREI
jgi:NADH dehydrogenase FAD-containing subunit